MVNFDPDTGQFVISGNSYPENSSKFYTPLLDWLTEFIRSGRRVPMVIEFNFDYFNTSSAKYILEILRVVQEYQELGNECLVRWYYFEDDTDMLESGEDYQVTIDVPFELVERMDTL
jgi:hypothetical protein